MSRRSVALVSMLSAVLACAITAAAFIAIDHGSDESQVVPTSFSADPASQLAAPTPPPDLVSAEPDPTAGYTRPAVDWSTIFAKVSSSVVAVYTSESAGSGFFVSEDGHIITNWHVVEDMAEIRIVMTDGTRADAEYIAKDLGNDLALLKIDARELDIDVLEYGKVEDLRVGDPVAALGAPYALPNTLTVGIISALDRLLPSGSGTWEPLRATIQTDAALNPGNSGGMLVDRFGRVIGIPTQIESPDRTSSGVGFAVSADAMLLALPTLIEGDDVERSYLGVTFQTQGSRLAITDVICDSAADAAGLRDRDLILRVNGAAINGFDDLLAAMRAIAPGDEFTITVRRGLRTLTRDATATAWPTEAPQTGCG